jgi:hypothetical protein
MEKINQEGGLGFRLNQREGFTIDPDALGSG